GRPSSSSCRCSPKALSAFPTLARKASCASWKHRGAPPPAAACSRRWSGYTKYMLKADWEKTGEIVSVGDDAIRAMAAQGLPRHKLRSHDVIAGGCANLNVKLSIEGRERPVILRLYIRDGKAAAREAALSKLVMPDIPAPDFLFAGEHDGRSFALVECLEGV